MGTYFKDRFLGLLPRMYEIADSNGDLAAYLEVKATEFDSLKDLIDEFTKLFDVDNVPAQYLPYLAKLIDYQYDGTGDAEVQRAEIKKLIDVYRMRGTIPGILRKLRLAGYPATLTETYPSIFTLGDDDRGFKPGVHLAGKKYSVGVFVIEIQKLFREIWGTVWDEVPRGTLMYLESQESSVMSNVVSPIGDFAASSDFRSGGVYPFKLFSGKSQMWSS